jgi:hypothetical protein
MKQLLTTVLILITASAFAQPGLKGGLNFATIGGDAAGVKSKTDFHVGFFFLTMESEKFGVQPEFIFSRQGAQASGVKINYDYVNVPVMFNYYPEENFFIQGGPQLGLLINAKIKDGDGSIDVKNQLTSLDLSLGLGCGYQSGSTIIGLRYNIGLTDTASDAPGKYPNRVLQLSIGFKVN